MMKWLRYLLGVAQNLVKSLRSATTWEIYLGDCVAGMHKLPGESVDVVVTSPPYNLGKEYSTYDDNKTPEEYLVRALGRPDCPGPETRRLPVP